eukprot:SAG22_NODE_1244_length_5021_cov_16.855547_9_plen_190_part_01
MLDIACKIRHGPPSLGLQHSGSHRPAAANNQTQIASQASNMTSHRQKGAARRGRQQAAGVLGSSPGRRTACSRRITQHGTAPTQRSPHTQTATPHSVSVSISISKGHKQRRGEAGSAASCWCPGLESRTTHSLLPPHHSIARHRHNAAHTHRQQHHTVSASASASAKGTNKGAARRGRQQAAGVLGSSPG